MNRLETLYRPSLSLLTDLYQLTMAYGYWKLGRHDQEAVFHLYFRRNPFKGGYAVACGLNEAADFLERLRFEPDDLDYLAGLLGNDQRQLFDRAFLDALRTFEFHCDVDAMPEGTVAFGNEPLVRVSGPILQCQIIESALLNFINFQTLIATKAARICQAAEGQPVVEYGLRRAQGIDGALTASRAAYIGGCVATSNVLAGKLYGIPVLGTHAHSWVMSFDDELQAFESYANVMPNNCVLLVDTYDTLEGVTHAVKIARKLADEGHKLIGVRLDSGDLAYLSIEARKILDRAGLKDVKIMASNELDEHLIQSLKHQGAAIDIWGVGTRLSTAYDQAALGGVYKLGAMRNSKSDPWTLKLKLSEQIAKTSLPGVLQVRRFTRDGSPVADAIYSQTIGIDANPTIVDPTDPTRRRPVGGSLQGEDLLVPIFRDGRRQYTPPPIDEIRRRAAEQVASLHPTVRRFVNPHEFPVGLESRLAERRTQLILQTREALSAKKNT